MRKPSRSKHQISLAAMLAAIGVASLWFGWAEAARDLADIEAARDPRNVSTTAVVFQLR
jgi:hypothetical protein